MCAYGQKKYFSHIPILLHCSSHRFLPVLWFWFLFHKKDWALETIKAIFFRNIDIQVICLDKNLIRSQLNSEVKSWQIVAVLLIPYYSLDSHYIKMVTKHWLSPISVFWMEVIKGEVIYEGIQPKEKKSSKHNSCQYIIYLDRWHVKPMTILLILLLLIIMIWNKSKFDDISRELFAIMILSDEKQVKNYVMISWMLVKQLLKIIFKLSRLNLTTGSKYFLYSGNTSQVSGFAH